MSLTSRELEIPSSDLYIYQHAAHILDSRGRVGADFCVYVPDPYGQIDSQGRYLLTRGLFKIVAMGGGNFKLFDRVVDSAKNLRDRLQKSVNSGGAGTTSDEIRQVVRSAIVRDATKLVPASAFRLY